MGPPVERKVQAASAATFVSGLALWALSRYVFQGSAVPDVLQSWIYAAAPAAVTFAAGYLTRHTRRPDLAPSVSTAGQPPQSGAAS